MARMGHDSERAALIDLHSPGERQRVLADPVCDTARAELARSKPRRAAKWRPVHLSLSDRGTPRLTDRWARDRHGLFVPNYLQGALLCGDLLCQFRLTSPCLSV